MESTGAASADHHLPSTITQLIMQHSTSSPRSEHSGEESGGSGSALKLGLGVTNDDDDFEEDDDLEKEYLHADDVELLEYQRQRSTPKIVIQEFEGEDERSAAFKEQQERQKKELFSQFYEQHLKAKYQNAPRYTMEEVETHDSELDCWTVVEGRIYNIAPFVSQHPGGKKILRAAGVDGTEIFKKYHTGIKLDETMLALLFEGFVLGSAEDKKHQGLEFVTTDEQAAVAQTHHQPPSVIEISDADADEAGAAQPLK